MPRPKTVSDEEIVSAARDVFLERGPSAPLSEIAKRVGLSQPALSQRFGSKRQLLAAALMPRSLPSWVAALEAGPDDRPFREQLVELAGSARRVLAEALPSILTLRHAGLPSDETGLPHELVALRLIAYFERAHERGLIELGDVQHVALVFLGTLQAEALATFFGSPPASSGPANSLPEFLADLLVPSSPS